MTFVCRQCLANPFRAAASPAFSRSLGPRAVSSASLPPYLSRHRPTHSPTLRHHIRLFQHLAQQPQQTDSPAARPANPTQSPAAQKAQAKEDISGDAIHISQAEQRKRDWNIVRKLAENLWPKDDWKTRGRVVLGLGLLVGGKVRSTSQFGGVFVLTRLILYSC